MTRRRVLAKSQHAGKATESFVVSPRNAVESRASAAAASERALGVLPRGGSRAARFF